MATFTITDNGAYISVTKDTKTRDYLKDNLKITTDTNSPSIVILTDTNFEDLMIDLDIDTVTAPAAPNAAVLASNIRAMAETAGKTYFVEGNSAQPRASFTRPANTTAYTIGDVMAGDTVVIPIEFTVSRKSNELAWCIGGACISSAAQGTLPTLDLMLFNDNFAVAADNAAFNPSDADMQNYYLGTIVFDSFKALSANSFSDGDVKEPILLTPASGNTKIYGVAVARSAYTPISGEVFTFVLHIEQN